MLIGFNAFREMSKILDYGALDSKHGYSIHYK